MKRMSRYLFLTIVAQRATIISPMVPLFWGSGGKNGSMHMKDE